MIKSWSKFIQLSEFIQWSSYDQNSYKCQIRSVTIFKDQKISLKKLIGIEFYDEIDL